MTSSRKKLATQVDAELLATVRSMAQSEGRPLQALVEEALADLIKKHRQATPRTHVMAAYQENRKKFGALYEKLAK